MTWRRTRGRRRRTRARRGRPPPPTLRSQEGGSRRSLRPGESLASEPPRLRAEARRRCGARDEGGGS
eukprot:7423288-Pyramimonas_sp.AAC.1